MDKNYYYRLLGVRSDATESQIRRAYEERMRKLKLPDYGDDPDYVAKKIAETRYAYSVVTGGAAPLTKAQVESRFERRKDVLDGGEDLEDKTSRRIDIARDRKRRTESRENHLRSSSADTRTSGSAKKTVVNLSESLGKAKETYSQYTGKLSGDMKKKGLATIIAVITIMISLIGSCASNISDNNDYYDYDYDNYSESYGYDEYTVEAVDVIYKISPKYDFYSYLELDPNASQNLGDIYEYNDDDLRNEMWNLCEALEIYDLSGALSYITGDDSAYSYYDGYQMASTIADVMMAPLPDELYGAKNLVRESTIENYYDYILFLEDIARLQTGALKNEGI